MPAFAEDADASGVLLRNTETGSTVQIPRYLTRADRVQELRARILTLDVQSSSASSVHVDIERKVYKFSTYPPLGFLLGVKWFVVVGAFLIAACSRIQFFFPCTGADTTAITWNGASYCVPRADIARVTPAACPADICVRRIPVSLQTYAVLLNGALAGRTGALGTALYVLMVCLGAPFGSDGASIPMWEKGAIVSPTGGFFIGFIFASLIMGVCAEKGHDRARSAHRLVAWMLAAEAVMYAFGLFWLPFGLAIRRGVHPSVVCPDFGTPSGAATCLSLVANTALVPFIPGELVKMLMVWITVPAAWWILLRVHAARSSGRLTWWTTSGQQAQGQGQDSESADAEAGTDSSLHADADAAVPSGQEGRPVGTTDLVPSLVSDRQGAGTVTVAGGGTAGVHDWTAAAPKQA